MLHARNLTINKACLLIYRNIKYKANRYVKMVSSNVLRMITSTDVSECWHPESTFMYNWKKVRSNIYFSPGYIFFLFYFFPVLFLLRFFKLLCQFCGIVQWCECLYYRCSYWPDAISLYKERCVVAACAWKTMYQKPDSNEIKSR